MYVVPRYSPESGSVPNSDELLQNEQFTAAPTTVMGELPLVEPANPGQVVVEPHELSTLRQAAGMTGHVVLERILGSREEAVQGLAVPEDKIPSDMLTINDPIASQQLWELGHKTDGIDVTVEPFPNGDVPTLGADKKDSLDLGQLALTNPGEATVPLFTHNIQEVAPGVDDTVPSLELPVLGTVHYSEPAPNPISTTREAVSGIHVRHSRAVVRYLRTLGLVRRAGSMVSAVKRRTA